MTFCFTSHQRKLFIYQSPILFEVNVNKWSSVFIFMVLLVFISRQPAAKQRLHQRLTSYSVSVQSVVSQASGRPLQLQQTFSIYKHVGPPFLSSTELLQIWYSLSVGISCLGSTHKPQWWEAVQRIKISYCRNVSIFSFLTKLFNINTSAPKLWYE